MASTNLLLSNESPFCFQPTLAVKFGLAESVLIQQIHYWLPRSRHTEFGIKWVRKTYEEWHEEMPFLTAKQIRDVLNRLEGQGVVLGMELSKNRSDRTKYYTLCYVHIQEITGSIRTDEIVSPSDDSVSPSDEIVSSRGDEIVSPSDEIVSSYIIGSTETTYREEEHKIEILPPAKPIQTSEPKKRGGCKYCKPVMGGQMFDHTLKEMHDVWREVFPGRGCHDLRQSTEIRNKLSAGVKKSEIVHWWRVYLLTADKWVIDQGYSIPEFIKRYNGLPDKEAEMEAAKPKPNEPPKRSRIDMEFEAYQLAEYRAKQNGGNIGDFLKKATEEVFARG
jgi:hypothetical protein